MRSLARGILIPGKPTVPVMCKTVTLHLFGENMHSAQAVSSDKSRSMIPEAVDDLLTMWAMWMKRGKVGTGYAGKSAGFLTGGINCYEDFKDSVDIGAVNTINTILSDLTHPQYSVISTSLRSDEHALLMTGIAEFQKRAVLRGVL